MKRRLLCQTPVLLAACGSSGGKSEVAFTELTMELFRPFAAGEYVWRSVDEMRAALQAAPFRVFPVGLVLSAPPEPAVDFTTAMVVGLSLGIGKWCFTPRLVRVLGDGHDLQVEYRIATQSTLACLRDGPLIAFAAVPKVAGRVEFIAVEG
jgi:hypothetical protein